MTKPTDSRRFAQEEFTPRNDWLERLARFNTQFGRFVRDAIGVALIAFAVMAFFAIWNWTDGILLTPIASILRTWFGWGSLLILVGIAYLGYSLLQRERGSIRWGRILALELAALLTLGLLATFSGNDLFRAESGMDGGRLGWGIVRLMWQMGTVLGTLVLFLLWALAVATGFGLWAKLEAWLIKIAGDEAPVIVNVPEPEFQPQVVEEPVVKQPVVPKKKAPAIPPEFRTQLKAEEKKQEKSLKPPPRGEDLPPLNILMGDSAVRADERTINQTAGLIMKTLSEFGIPATVIGYRVGPSVTQFAVQPGFIKRGNEEEDAQQMKVRVAQIASLEKDLALALSAQRLRIEAPVPGKPYVGIEVPNLNSSVVRMRALLESDSFYKVGAPLAVALGRDVSGNPVNADLARMPHLLIAGST
ncbi:MAG: DNA translocase FtsK, partial [Chloroflexota bacterium]